KFLEVRNLFLKKVPRRKVFGKSETLFSKKGFRSRSKRVFPLNRKNSWEGLERSHVDRIGRDFEEFSGNSSF
ncbi:MAG: hypothetical protein D6805_10495, partial [Planctomycetota bacterium]